MKIVQLKLLTNKLKEEKTFYTQTLGFELVADFPDHFTVKVGWSELTFEESLESHTYHYCFLIPSNMLQEALTWMEKRVDILPIEKEKKTHLFDSWNAKSFYFYDASGNIAEFIVRFDLENESTSIFGIEQVLCVNEIGTPTKNIPSANDFLEKHLKLRLWKGDLKRFAVIGGQQGLLLLPNYDLKDNWFPTTIRIKPAQVEVVIQNLDQQYYLEFKEEKFKVRSLEK